MTSHSCLCHYCFSIFSVLVFSKINIDFICIACHIKKSCNIGLSMFMLCMCVLSAKCPMFKFHDILIHYDIPNLRSILQANHS